MQVGFYLQPIEVGTARHLDVVQCAQHMTGARSKARELLASSPGLQEIAIMTHEYGVMDCILRKWEVVRTKDGHVERLSWPFKRLADAEAYMANTAGGVMSGFVISVREWDGH